MFHQATFHFVLNAFYTAICFVLMQKLFHFIYYGVDLSLIHISPNMEQDLYWLKKKVEAGADYVVTQMFYDNRKYVDFCLLYTSRCV